MSSCSKAKQWREALDLWERVGEPGQPVSAFWLAGLMGGWGGRGEVEKKLRFCVFSVASVTLFISLLQFSVSFFRKSGVRLLP